ncbi:MAG: hemolysin family protein [Treponema sp.]
MKLFDRFKKKKPDVNASDDVNEQRQGMLQGVVDLADTVVKEVMIPRIDVDFLSIDTAYSELLDKVVESGHSRFPVYEDSIDNVVGVLYVKDMLRLIARGKEVKVAEIIKKPFFVPESKRIDGLLMEFKRKHVHIAVAIDEYGGTSGIVCMEDIIEEIVGDIQDEFDNEREDITKLGDGMWLCDSRVDLEDLASVLGEQMPTDDFDTLGGFVFDLFGKIPIKFEKATWKDYDFIVHDVEGHKVNTIKIIKHKNIN